jgi:hypothetical protein
MSTYSNLRKHMDYHKIKCWLLDGAEREDAQTIRRAIERTSSRDICRALAWAICDEREA